MTADVRAAVVADLPGIKALATGNGMFGLDEVDGFDAPFEAFLDGTMADHRWIVVGREDGEVDGAAYYAPEPFSDRVWNLYFIAARPGGHRRGTGSALLAHVERTLHDQGEDVARILIVETSSGDAYGPARTFYADKGFEREAEIREFYGPGDNKIIFWKALVAGI